MPQALESFTTADGHTFAKGQIVADDHPILSTHGASFGVVAVTVTEPTAEQAQPPRENAAPADEQATAAPEKRARTTPAA